MKSRIFTALVAASLVSLAACGGGDEVEMEGGPVTGDTAMIGASVDTTTMGAMPPATMDTTTMGAGTDTTAMGADTGAAGTDTTTGGTTP